MAWWHEDYIARRPVTTQVDDVKLIQPIGFVWFTKPRYRVKCISKSSLPQEKANELRQRPPE